MGKITRVRVGDQVCEVAKVEDAKYKGEQLIANIVGTYIGESQKAVFQAKKKAIDALGKALGKELTREEYLKALDRLKKAKKLIEL